jgi:hypothetical protein
MSDAVGGRVRERRKRRKGGTRFQVINDFLDLALILL